MDHATLIDHVKHRLRVVLPASLVELQDDSHLHRDHHGNHNKGAHFSICVVSAQFVGKNTVARHRMIYAALQDEMKHYIHALAIDARTPDEHLVKTQQFSS